VADTPTRRRGADLEEAILEAAWAEMAERGWAEFTIAGVARRCGTAKPVIYRRWDNRVDLARSMLERAIHVDPPQTTSSGDLRADLVAFLHGLAGFLAGPFGEAVRGSVIEPVRAEDAAILGPVPAHVAAVVAAALQRGDLEETPPHLVQNLGPALMIHELVHRGRPPSRELVQQIADHAWWPAFAPYLRG
jgi:AcrR family transcriptional regulator